MWASCCSMEICRSSGGQATLPKVATSAAGFSPSQSAASPTLAASSPAAASSAASGSPAVGAGKNGTGGFAAAAVPQLSKRNLNKLDSMETASVASTQKNSTRSAYSGASSIGSEFIRDQIPTHQRDVAKIQSQMKGFVKSMVRGREMNVLSVDGQLRACTCSFDRKLRNYNIVISKETRSIPLSKIREVFQGSEPEDIATPLDELCATFVLESGECLSFRFKDIPEREHFAMCLQIIVDGHQ
eukprot:TRINITY_DN106836_c0_g1_i1.p1 TRINITY_DN106836_c0_g1~~TRINITY_DN106836_c0_g1_i1.p1  ORF type:complete len:243 (+),score=60.30 TRINITY_DN106836_c0_g1_i1:110-838(+)